MTAVDHFKEHFNDYGRRLSSAMNAFDPSSLAELADELKECWRAKRKLFLAGNGGSAGNAVHLANDFLYAMSKRPRSGLAVEALPANPAVMTCLANDEGYENVFAFQLAIQARPGDILLVLSGSGNSSNILLALEEAKRIGMKSYAIVAFDGGRAKSLADVALHVPSGDMQIAEDMQLIFGHMLVQWLATFCDEMA